ncbi:hypothetical protein Tcan_16813 [Toxocara canis]|uniref:Uncharacterized protein n=1 Tax=Toxocara canis TaxID=6265 RepID=A0A0B2VKI9_TOXCA|nr:hypothetical protein Tcan_16813 [Toxocara canis]
MAEDLNGCEHLKVWRHPTKNCKGKLIVGKGYECFMSRLQYALEYANECQVDRTAFLTIRSRLRRLGSWGRQRATCEGPTGSEALAPTLESRSTASRDGPPTASNGASPDDQSRQSTGSQD